MASLGGYEMRILILIILMVLGTHVISICLAACRSFCFTILEIYHKHFSNCNLKPKYSTFAIIAGSPSEDASHLLFKINIFGFDKRVLTLWKKLFSCKMNDSIIWKDLQLCLQWELSGCEQSFIINPKSYEAILKPFLLFKFCSFKE